MKYVAIFLVSLYAGASYADSHCVKGEIDYFSCQLENSKVVSVCGTRLKDSETYEEIDGAWIQYRIGRINQIEFVFPESRTDSTTKFEGSDFHPHGEEHSVLDLRFINHNALYSIALVSGNRLTGSVSAELNHKLSAHSCRGTIKSSYWESFRELIWFISARNGQIFSTSSIKNMTGNNTANPSINTDWRDKAAPASYVKR